MNAKAVAFVGRAFVTNRLLGALLLITGCQANLDPLTEGATSDLAPISPAADAAHILSGKKAYKDDGSVLTGSMNDLGAVDLSQSFSGPGYVASVTGLASADVCSSANFLGLPGTAVCTGGTSSLNASVPFVAGSYNAVSNAPTAGDIRSGVTVFGVSGSSSVVNTAAGDAIAVEIVSGKKAYVNGALVTGTATNHGALNLNTTAIPGSSGGFYSSLALTLPLSSVCIGSYIFGSEGTAVCTNAFGNFTASNMHRDSVTAQMTLSTEVTSSSYAAGYREVPLILKDDDGYWTGEQGCTTTGGVSDTCSTVVKAQRPSVACGTSGTVAARIADCVAKNSVTATWTGSANGLAGEATWKLVTFKNSFETWRDERTGLLWSDKMPSGSYTWCYASGSSGGGPLAEDDPADICDNPAFQDQTTPYSVCAEVSGFQSPDGEDYAGGTSYSDAKGGMGALSATVIRWRLPTRTDYLQAEIDGIRFVLPNMGMYFWSATVSSRARERAWSFNGSQGNMIESFAGNDRGFNNPGFDGGVRCVGR